MLVQRHASVVDAKLAELAGRQGEVFSYQDALSCGYTLSQVRREVRARRWRRLCRGQYTAAVIDESSAPWEQGRQLHRLRMIAASRAFHGHVVLSHQSAVVTHGLPTWGLDLGSVHVTRRDCASGRVVDDVVQHRAQLPAGSIWLKEGLEVVAPARAIVEIACTAGFEPALAIADEALRTGLVTRRTLCSEVCDAEHWPRSPAAKQVLDFCDARAGSVGESRLRVLMDRQGLPAPVLQAPMSQGGEPFAFVDFYFPEPYNTVVEFDGMQKYGGNTSEIVIREKWREDAIRELGNQFVRIVWADLAQPAKTAARIRRAFAFADAARQAS